MTPNSTAPARFRSLDLLWFACGMGVCCVGLGMLLFAPVEWLVTWGDKARRLKEDYRYIPPEWMTYRQTAVIKCPVVGQPTCFAARNDSTFIIGTDNPPALSFFSSDGTFLHKIDLPGEPTAVASSATGRIVVAHSQSIAFYSAEGNWESSRKLPDEKSDVRSLVAAPGYIFAADTGTRSIHRLDADGKFDLTFGESFVVYAAPITMTYSPQTDLLYITNPGRHRVEAFTQEGIPKPELNWGEPSASLSGFAGCCNPIDLAVLDDGRILTVEKAVSRIKIFGLDRQLDCVVAGYDILEDTPPGSRRSPLKPDQRHFAAAVLSEERIAVLDFSVLDSQYAMVRIFAPATE